MSTANLKESRAGLGILDLGQDAENAHNDTQYQIEGDKELMQAAAISLKSKGKVLTNIHKHAI